MKLLPYLHTLSFTLLSLVGLSQSQTISGQVIDAETKEALVSASLKVNTSKQGSLSDEQGYFELSFEQASHADSLIISYIGYSAEVIAIQDLKQTNNIISLVQDVNSIEEVVVSPVNADSIIFLMEKNYVKNHIKGGTYQEGFLRSKFRKDNDVIQVGETSYNMYFQEKKDSKIERMEQTAFVNKSRMVIDSVAYSQINEIINLKKDTITIEPDFFTSFLKRTAKRNVDEYEEDEDVDYEFLGYDTIDNRAAYRISMKARGKKDVELFKGTLLIDKESYALVSEQYETQNEERMIKEIPFVYRTALRLMGFQFQFKKMRYSLYYKQNGDHFDLDKGMVYLALDFARKGNWYRNANAIAEFYHAPRKEGELSEDSDAKLVKNTNVVSQFTPNYFNEFYHLATNQRTLNVIDQINQRNEEFSGSIYSSKHKKWLKRKGKLKE